MNPNSFRREVLVCVGGFVAGGLAVAIAIWPQRPLGLQVTHAAPGVNYVVVTKPASSPLVAKRLNVTSAAELGVAPEIASPNVIRDVSFEEEFGLLRVPRPIRAIGLPAKPPLFDIPRQQPWVAPYEFLIHPDQKH